jgi:uncharacterized membrane protein HdeD (DUF308 family)
MPLRSVPIEFVRNNRWSKTTNGRIIGRPQEAIMATRSGKTGLFAFDPARCDALSEVLAERWWAVGLRGIVAIIFGLICLLTPGIALGAFVIVFAAYMFVDGVFAIISGIRAARSGENWGLLILEGVVDLAAGAIAVLWPAITLVVLVWIVAIWAIVSGALMLAAAFSLNLDYGRWWLALGGIASTVFGILLVIEPFIGAVVLTLWIGAYALVFGVFLLVLGFQLHSKREAQLRKVPAAAKKA